MTMLVIFYLSNLDRRDMVFYARHPELNGRTLRPDERLLALEWFQIRATLVRTAISRLRIATATTAPTTLTVQPSNLSRVPWA
jgi:hypothetical protein